VSEIIEYAGGHLTEKSNAGKMKFDDEVVVALDASLVAGRLIGGVPKSND